MTENGRHAVGAGSRLWAPLLAAAALVAGAAATLGAAPDLRLAYPWMILLLIPATTGWALGVRWATRGAPARRAEMGVMLGVALAGRLVLTVPEGPLSDDLYRYLWDGRVGNAGIHPFRHAPDSPELAPLRDDLVWPEINHPEVPTIYPPVAQLYFRFLDAASGNPRAPRVAAALLDAVTVLLLAMLLRGRGRPPALAVVYAWCPLTLLESGGGGHVDAPGVLLLVGGLVAADRPGRVAVLVGGLLLGLSAMVKPTAALVAPALLWRAPGHRRAILLSGAALALLSGLPYAAAGEQLFTGLRAYLTHWRFNDAIYSALVHAGAAPGVTRVALAAATVAIALALPLRWRDPLASAGTAIAAALSLSPTVHPWYALWLIAFLPFLPTSVKGAAFAFVALLPLTYVSAWTFARDGVWVEPIWTRWVVWGVPGALFIVGTIRSRVRRSE